MTTMEFFHVATISWNKHLKELHCNQYERIQQTAISKNLRNLELRHVTFLLDLSAFSVICYVCSISKSNILNKAMQISVVK